MSFDLTQPHFVLEAALTDAGLRWYWQRVVVPAAAPARAEYVIDALPPSSLPCYAVPDAPWVLEVSCKAWCPTAADTAAFGQEVAELLQQCPAYPLAQVTLPAAPVMEIVPPQALPPASLADLVGHRLIELDAYAAQTSAVRDWLAACAQLISAECQRTEEEGRFLHEAVKASRFQNWHVSGADPHANTIRVDGRDLWISPGSPTGTSRDLSTFYLGEALNRVWRASWRPVLRISSADYGSRRVRVTLGKGRAAPAYWLDLGTMALKPVRAR